MTPDKIRRLAASGFSSEQIATIGDIMEAKSDAQLLRRDKDRARLRNWRETRRNGVKRVSVVSAPENVVVSMAAKRDETAARVRVEDSSFNLEISGQKKEKEKGSGERKRSTRLTEDWIIPREWLQEAVTAGLTWLQAEKEAGKMRNWSLGSKNGAKLDWHAAWRNWVTKAVDELPSSQPQYNPMTMALKRLQNPQHKTEDDIYGKLFPSIAGSNQQGSGVTLLIDGVSKRH